MSTRRHALVAGVLVGVAYLALAAVSGHLSPLARRPLLDGFAPPPPYRWVKPPPSLASTNEQPQSARRSLRIDPQKGSTAGVVTTTDIQASVILPTAAFPPKPPASKVVVTISPLAPIASPTLPVNLVIAGNVYRFQAAYDDGAALTQLSKSGTLSLLYPVAPDNLLHHYVLLRSKNGRVWHAISSQNSAVQLQVTGTVQELGFYAVGQSVAGSKKPFPVGRLIYYLLIGALVAFLVVRIVLSEVRRRRKGTGRRS